MPKKISDFTLTSGQITGHSKENGEGSFNFWNFESFSKQGVKIGYGSVHTQVFEALGVEDQIQKGCLVKIKVEVYEKPEATNLASGKGNEF